MRYYASIGCAAAILLMGGSCVTSRKPLLDPAKGVFDLGLCGSWKLEAKASDPKVDKLSILHVGRFQNAAGLNWGNAVFVQTTNSGEIQMSEYIGFVSQKEGRKYLNAGVASDIKTLRKETDKSKVLDALDQYFLLKYEIRDDKLHLWLSDNQFVQKAIAKGRVTGNGFTLDDTSEKVLELLSNHDAEIFTHEVVFVRLK